MRVVQWSEDENKCSIELVRAYWSNIALKKNSSRYFGQISFMKPILDEAVLSSTALYGNLES